MIQYLLDGQVCHPKNRQEIKFIIDYSERNRVNEFEISIDNLIFVREDKERIHQYLATYGNKYGMPFAIQFTNGQILSYFIDFTDEATRYNADEFHAKIKRYRANVNFFDKADGLSWRLMEREGFWQDSDFTNIRYVIIPEQQPLYFITLSLAFFATVQQIAQAVEDIQSGIADLTEAVTPSFAGPVPVINVGQVISLTIRLVARIIKGVVLVIALINIMQQIIEMIMPAVRTMRDIPYLHLIRKGCQYLGYTLDTSAINELQPLSFLGAPEKQFDMGIMREIFRPLSSAFTWGFPSEMDSITTLGQAIDKLETIYNLRTTVNNGVVRIEPRLLQGQTAPIPLAYNEQDAAHMTRSFTNDHWKRKVLMWRKDVKDVWTFDDKKGHLAELDTDVINAPDPNLKLLKGAVIVDNPFALASRKEELTRVEKFLKNTLAPAVDLFTNGGFSAQINNRVGVMVISSQYFTVNKLLWKVGENIHPQHRDILNAKRILEVYHGSETVAARNKEKIENMPIRMTESNFLLLSSQNVVNLSNGEQAELVRLEWSENDAEAAADLLVNTVYNTNIQQSTIYGAGY
jgi:hypothetical protein